MLGFLDFVLSYYDFQSSFGKTSTSDEFKGSKINSLGLCYTQIDTTFVTEYWISYHMNTGSSHSVTKIGFGNSNTKYYGH